MIMAHSAGMTRPESAAPTNPPPGPVARSDCSTRATHTEPTPTGTPNSPPTVKMRITDQQAQAIREIVHATAGSDASVTLFGSRLDDQARGGDLDLLVECPEAIVEPATLAATLAARISRTMHGRKVDILLLAPNLVHQPIHTIAKERGRPL